MEELASLWDYQESIDELKQKLFYTTLELESVSLQANQEICKYKENVNQLLQLLKTVYKERDEARDQIQKLRYSFTSFNPQTGTINPVQVQVSKANLSKTESNSLSDTYNYQSPNDPFFDIVSSPDSSNLGYLNQQQQQPPCVLDQGSLVIDTLARGKILPQKGKLLQAVLEVGPLLNTLLLAGPLPRWRNPPPIQGFHIPPVSEIVKPNLNSKSYSSSEMGCGTSEMLSPGLLMHFNKGSCFRGVKVSDNGLLGKRQRLH